MQQIAMKTLVFAVLLGTVLQDAAALIHSLKYFYTASSGVPNFPEFVAVGMVDDVQMDYYDSNTRRAEPKQDWMNKLTADNPQYWERETQTGMDNQQWYKANIEIIKQRFNQNQTGGVHTYQRMYGCEWDDETDEVNGFTQWGYDGEDFIVFDLKTETWIAPKQQAQITKRKWDHNKAFIAQRKNYLTQICPEWLKKYVNYGRSSLMRTVLPSVSLLQQTPSSPVRCFASGFYPERASLFWRKDGVELHEDVELGETLPNTDGNFQMSADLKVSSIKPEDWEKYECVFQLSGEGDKVTKLDKTAIKTNYGKTEIRGGEELPSVSLLQQTPSSPVRCFASGFYPERASLFWRKDGDDLHEDVEHGEILPNTDGTFQMSVDLKVSSIKPEDWRRYECVFRLSGVKDDIVTKLDKTAIKTNYETPINMVPIVAAVVVVALIVAGIVGVGLYMFKGKRNDSKSSIKSAVAAQDSGSSSSTSTGSGDSSKPLMDNREVTRNGFEDRG